MCNAGLITQWLFLNQGSKCEHISIEKEGSCLQYMTLRCILTFVVSDDDGVIISQRRGKERASINYSPDESDLCSK